MHKHRAAQALRLAFRRTVLIAPLAASFALAGLVAKATAQSSPDPEALAKSARDVARQFTEKYHTALDELLQDGLRRALSEYVSTVTDVTAEVTENTTIDIARVSVKPRAPEHEPDAWEKAQLEALTQKKAQGAAAETLESYTVTTTQEGQKIFRFFKPMIAEARCMGCHGKDIEPDLKRDIATDYADDKATGYAVGDILGAISLVQPIE